ncbi:hypothetical protein K4F52_010361 [Lecanicillium sp. MT-2017a]|nr:hypothetical protein K4F52_010361 [Lecanicillium sp. MT-2017a]
MQENIAPRFSRLPTELILEIASKLTDRQAVNAFARSCRFLYERINPYLYKERGLRDNYALLWAAEMGKDKTARRAIQYGADVNASLDCAPTVAAFSGRADDTKPLESRLSGYTAFSGRPLLIAVYVKSIELVKLLLAHKKIDVNLRGTRSETALHIACQAGNPDIVKMLTAHPDIDINARMRYMQEDYSALDWAMLQLEEPLQLASLLIQHEALDRAAATQYIVKAALEGYSEIVKLLLPYANASVLRQAADVDSCDDAKQERLEQLVRHLLTQPAVDVNAADPWGQTALHRGV